MNKYGARKTTVDGITFDSAREASRWCQLRLMERAGELWSLSRQVPFRLVPAEKGPDGRKLRELRYIADFVYKDVRGWHVEDSKGFRTKEYQLKKRLMWHYYGIKVEEV